MKISYDKEVDALSITFKEGKVSKSLEVVPEVILDVDSKNRPLYLEIIGLTEKFGKKAAEKISIKNFDFINSKRVAA
jgi:uncharacterized protein YuzE